jgi:hypothetical protein
MFMDETNNDYRITTTNATIVDAITMTVDGGGAIPNHDFFNNPRPHGPGADIGAHEK